MKINAAFALLLVVEAIQLNTDHSFLAQNNAKVQKLLNGAQAHKDEAVPPVSTTMKCIINLTVQYFIVYTALAVTGVSVRGP